MASMEVPMKAFLSLFMIAAATTACADTSPERSSAPANEMAGSGLALEEALADAESGRDLRKTQATLEGLLADTSLSKEDHVRVVTTLAKLLEGVDRERALRLNEEAIAAGDEGAEGRLFTLLTGQVAPSRWRHRDDSPIASVTFPLAKYFPAATPERHVEIDIVTFGNSDYERASSELGTWAIGAALHQNATEACGFCDEVKTSIHTHQSGERLWSAIPRYAARLEKALTVLYITRETMVPERYAKWLAAQRSEVEEAIERGDGLIAVKERPGAPPLVTIAAPRVAQLVTVEAKFAAMRELPKQPATIELKEELTHHELSDGMHRLSTGTCARELVKRQPAAAYQLEVGFTILGTGDVINVGFKGKLPNDTTFASCIERTITGAKFPAWSRDPKAKKDTAIRIGRSPAFESLDPDAKAAAIGTAIGGTVVRVTERP